MSKPNQAEKTLNQLKKEWQEKYGEGNLRELISGKKSVIVFVPYVDLRKMKAVITARKTSLSHMVDSILNNCFLYGDESLKKDEEFKLGIEDAVENLIDVPECEVDSVNGNILLTTNGVSLEVRKAGRGDIRFAEDKNPERKALDTPIHLLERLAVNAEQLEEIKKNVPVYISMLFEVTKLKDKKDVEIKNF